MWLLFAFLAVVWAIAPTGFPTTVSYDSRAFTINGTRQLLLSGSVHYPRATPEEWPHLLKLTKAGGIDVVETYVFWDVHQPTGPSDWVFTGNADLWGFLKACQDAGLFVNFRIGPYACAEWKLGGIPIWVKNIPGIVFRDNDPQWTEAMGTFVTRIVKEAHDRKMYAFQGGPIILSQIENEYGSVESAYKDPKGYINWAVELALSLENKQPWVMCVQDDAPNAVNLVNTCNGFYCDNWLPTHFATRNTPAAWTENWPGWFQHWGEPKPHRTVKDVAFSVARWIARGGSYMNYYMWFGGSNWGRTTGGPMIVTSYDYDVALNEYGLPHNPKYSHSAELHRILKSYASVILSNPVDPGTPLDNNVFVNVYGKTDNPQKCVAFLSNVDNTNHTVTWNHFTYHIPAWSVSILGGCTSHVTFNTASVHAYENNIKKTTYLLKHVAEGGWSWWQDTAGIWDQSSVIVSAKPQEQIHLTNDTTDYLWYSTSVTSQEAEESVQLKLPARDVVYAFVNGKYQGMGVTADFVTIPLTLPAGSSTLSILSQSVGLQNFGKHYESSIIDGLASGKVTLGGADITSPAGGWKQQIGLKGESLKLWTLQGQSRVTWNHDPESGLGKPLVWWKISFPTPPGIGHLALEMSGTAKGFAYVNGHGVGRYWNIVASGSCPPCSEIEQQCDYRGAYEPGRCRCDCGQPSQLYYKVPRSWLKTDATLNTLVLFEEQGATAIHKVRFHLIE